MKALIIIISTAIALHTTDKLAGSTWVCKITNTSADTLKLGLSNDIRYYSCEQKYTYHGSYSLSKDSLIIIEKDDSKDGKVDYYRKKFILKSNMLYPVVNEELINKKWKKTRLQMDKGYILHKI